MNENNKFEASINPTDSISSSSPTPPLPKMMVVTEDSASDSEQAASNIDSGELQDIKSQQSIEGDYMSVATQQSIATTTTASLSPSITSETNPNMTSMDVTEEGYMTPPHTAMSTSTQNIPSLNTTTASSIQESTKRPFSSTSKLFDFPTGEYSIVDKSQYFWHIPKWQNVVSIVSESSKRRPSSQPAMLDQPREIFIRNLAMSGKLASPRFKLVGHEWQLIICPVGNQTEIREDITIYLTCLDEYPSDQDWAVCTQLVFAAVKGDESEVSDLTQDKVFAKSTQHRFDVHDPDWGFGAFASHRQLSKLLVGDALNIFLKIRIIEDPTGVLWHSFVHYNSKKATGYIGILNQGATCYMNSLLQSLFLLGHFRKAVYTIPTQTEDPNDSIPYALQRIFYRLQSGDSAISTTELTRSFGWDSSQAFMQHDVQEFSRVLLDELESKMKDCPSEGAIENLFGGRMKNVIRCLNVDFQSVRSESFYDLQLAVKGFNTLQESFEEYIRPEYLVESNKYHAEEFGMQDAKRFVAFERLPPVLHCHLVRYTFDPETGDIAKYNGRFEFPVRIDLANYLSEDTPEEERSRPQVYLLHAVLVHSGDVGGGHYYVFWRNYKTGQWLKFDDTRVVKVTEKEAVDDNFGGDSDEGPVSKTRSPSGIIALKKFTNAYMLVYVREADIESVQADILPEDVSTHISEAIHTEQQAEDLKRQERLAQLQSMSVRIVVDDIITQHSGFDLFNVDNFVQPITKPLLLDIKRDETIERLRVIMAIKLGLVDPDLEPEKQLEMAFKIGLWTFSLRKNRTVRIDSFIPNSNNDRPISSLVVDRLTQQIPILYATVFDDETLRLISEQASEKNILLWFKIVEQSSEIDPLFPSKLTLRPLTWVVAKQSETLEAVMPRLRRRTSSLTAKNYKFYEEVKPGRIEGYNPSYTFTRCDIRSGDIIVLCEANINALEYYDDLQSRISVELVQNKRQGSRSIIVLSLKMSGEKVTEVVSKHLDCPAQSLRLLLADRVTDLPTQTTIKPDAKALFDYIKRPGFLSSTSTVSTPTAITLYYEILQGGLTIKDIEGITPIHIQWKDEQHSVYVTPGSTIGQVVRSIDGVDEEKGPYALLEISNNRITLIYKTSMPSSLPSTPLILIRLPGDSERFIAAFHYFRDPLITHSTPFLFPLIPEEVWEQTKARIVEFSKRLDELDDDVTVSLVSISTSSIPRISTIHQIPMTETDILYNKKLEFDQVNPDSLVEQIGIDHTPPSSTKIMPGLSLGASLQQQQQQQQQSQQHSSPASSGSIRIKSKK